MATFQPSLSSPTMFSIGTCTSSNMIWLKLWAPAMLMIGFTCMPGDFMSTNRKVIPECRSASRSVRTSMNIMSARCASDVQIFEPLITNSSPWSSAKVCNDAKSEPVFGSEYPWHNPPCAISGRYFRFCSSEPKCINVGPNIRVPKRSFPGARRYEVSSAKIKLIIAEAS